MRAKRGITSARRRLRQALVICACLAFVAPQRHGLVFAAKALPTADARQEARARYEQGARAYSEARYDEAILHFAAAYAIEPAGALLLNIAQANRLKSPPNCDAALRHYELYLAAEPRSAERAEVQGHIVHMRQCLQQEAKVDEPRESATASRATVPTSEPATASSAPVWLTLSGAAVLVGGAALYTAARLRFNTLQSECPCPDDTIDRWQTLTNVSYASLALGSLTTVSGLLWWRLQGGTRNERRLPQSSLHTSVPGLWFSHRGLGFSWQGRF